MANSIYTASITVDFKRADDSTEILQVEVDSREDGLNSGRTSFVPGVDKPAILIFKSTPVVITGKDLTVGNLNSLGHGTFQVEEYLHFVQDREVALTYPISSGFTYKWIGRDNGVVTQSETAISLPSEVLGVLKITYNSTYQAFELANVPAIVDGETEFPVLVYVAGEA